jgi:ATP-dependent Clp protease ATP-binding subunit ClpA
LIEIYFDCEYFATGDPPMSLLKKLNKMTQSAHQLLGVHFVIFLLVSVVSQQILASEFTVFWKGQHVAFSIVNQSQNGIAQKGLAIKPSPNRPAVVALEGVPKVFPFDGASRTQVEPSSQVLDSVPAQFPYQVAVIGDSVVILDCLGWIVRTGIPSAQKPMIHARPFGVQGEALLLISYKDSYGKWVYFVYYRNGLFALPQKTSEALMPNGEIPLGVPFTGLSATDKAVITHAPNELGVLFNAALHAQQATVYALNHSGVAIRKLTSTLANEQAAKDALLLNFKFTEYPSHEKGKAGASGSSESGNQDEDQAPNSSAKSADGKSGDNSKSNPVTYPAPSPLLALEGPKNGGSGGSNLSGNGSTEAKDKRTPAEKLDVLRKSKQARQDLLSSLKSEVYGQENALEQMAAQYSEAKKSNSGRPKVLMAMGPSGSGKTYSANQFAKILGMKTLEVEGNEYRSHAGALTYMKLLGGPNLPEDGILVKVAKDNPNGFTLIINEGEKMHRDVWMMLMNFLDAGKISDRTGKDVFVKNLWVIVTSNRGSNRMFPPSARGWTQAEVERRARQFTQTELQDYFLQKEGLRDENQFPPEISRRFDQYVAFVPTTQEAASQMARDAALRLSTEYKQEFSIELALDPAVIDDIAFTAWSVSNDARTIHRSVRSMMSELLDEALDVLDLKGGETIKVVLKKDANDRKVYEASANGHSLNLAAAKNPFENPLFDPEFRKRLRNMKALMSEIVVGQDEVVGEMSDALLSHFGRGAPTRPFSSYLIGPSGNGKTETGRALAKVIYGDESRVAIIPMGNVSSSSDFDSIFGSGAQFQGGDVERLFERSLRENPNGAVIVLDEISNMGGGDLGRKTALFQKIYHLLEEGRYTSPMDGREYPLSRYQFVLTGNDGENLFRGLTSDDLLLSVWRKCKTQEEVREIMRSSGIPNAFVNRLGVIALTKPLLKSEVEFVTKKLWSRQLREFLAMYPGLEVEPTPQFMAQLARVFFTADQGGRSVRKVLENSVGAILLRSLLDADVDLSNLRGIKMVVDLSDTTPSRPFRPVGFERSVLFSTQVFKTASGGGAQNVAGGAVVDTEAGGNNGRELIYSGRLDMTHLAPQILLQNKIEARTTAYHEAGHAVANQEDKTGAGISFITIRGGSMGKLKFLGYARYEELKSHVGVNPNRESVVASIAKSYAGRKAQEMAGFPADAGWAKDLEQIRGLATRYLMEWGLDFDFIGLPLDGNGRPMVGGEKAKLFSQHFDELIHDGELEAERLLKANWRVVMAVSADLMAKGEIDRERFLYLKKRYEGAPIPMRMDGTPAYREVPSGARRAVVAPAAATGATATGTAAVAAVNRCENVFMAH